MPSLKYRIVFEPQRMSYEALIRYCATEGEICTLADCFPENASGKRARSQFLERARPSLRAIEMIGRWPVGEPQTGNSAKPTPLWTFTLENSLIELLLNGPRGLYGWKSPKFPEDLAVYRKDGSVLLGTVAHEHIGWMNFSAQEASDFRLGLIELKLER